MLRHAQPVIDRAVAAGREQPGRGTQVVRRHAGQHLGCLGAVARLRDEGGVVAEFVPVAAFADEGLVIQALGHHHMRDRRHDRHVGAGPQRQVMRRLDMRRSHQVDPARIDHDQLGARAQTLFQPAGKDRVPVGRVGADDDDHVGLLDAVEILRARAGAERRLQPVTRGRMADPRAGVGVVVAKHRADHLLDEEGLLVGAPARRDAADGAAPVPGLDVAQPGRGEVYRLVPADFAPRRLDAVADHRVQDAVLVAGIAPGEPPLHAGMATIGLAVLVGRHAH